MNLRLAVVLSSFSFALPGLALAQVPVRNPLAPKSPLTPKSRPMPPPPIAGKAAPVAPPGGGAGESTTASQPSPPPSEETEARRGRNREAARKKGKFQLDFDKADITDVIQTISDFTGKLFIVPENIRGKITIIGPEDGTGFVTADEAYSAFLAALEANNWTVYPVGRYLKLTEKRTAATNNVWTYLDPKADIPDDERMVTKIIKLHYIDADTIQGPLKQLLSKDHQLTAMPPDTLIVTEVALNLRRVERIIDALDQPGGGEELRVIQIEYATAADIAEKLLAIFEEKGGGATAKGSRKAVPKAGMPAPTPSPGGEGGAEGGLEAGPVSISRVIPDERTNKLIVTANTKAFKRIEDLIKQLDIPTGDTGRVNVYYLENANAEDLAGTLQALTSGAGSGSSAGGGAKPKPARKGIGVGATPAAGTAAAGGAELFGGEVKISPDKSTNSLVIVASSQDYKNLTKVIEKLDLPRRQVFVEAVIMEVNLRKVNDFGMSLHGGYAVETDEGIAPLIIGSQTGKASSLNLASLVSLGGFMAGLQGPPVSASAELGVSLPAFGVVMHALAKSSDVNVLSTPHILTSDNEEAEITVGQNVPFQAGFAPPGLQSLAGSLTGGASGTGNAAALAGALGGGGGLGSFFAPIQRQNVELKLKIKPQINESNYVRMEVEEQTEEIAEQDPQLGPTTAKRTAKTVIVAHDQSTVVIGGLIQDRTISSVSKTPILGDIPVLGWLFRDTSTTKLKTNLLLFLTPYIIQDQSDFRRIFERKMKEREEFIAAFYGTPLGYEVPIDYARKAGPVARLSKTVRSEARKIEHGGEGLPGEKAIVPAPGGDGKAEETPAGSSNPAPEPGPDSPGQAAPRSPGEGG